MTTTNLLAFIDLTAAPALIILAECFGLLFIGKMIFDISTPRFRVTRQLGEQKNLALGVTMAMYYLALAVVVTGIAADVTPTGAVAEVFDESASLATTTAPATTAPATAPAAAAPLAIVWGDVTEAMGQLAIWGIVGIVLLGVSRMANDRLILHKFDTTKEIIDDKNVGTGVVEGASYLASAFIIRASVVGDGSGGDGDLASALPPTILFFVISQVILAGFAIVYQKITKYDLHAEIEKDNVAVGVAMAGSMVALGIILGAGQTFASGENLGSQVLSFVVLSLIAMAALVVLKYVTDLVILTKIDLDKELAANRNVAVACVAAVIPIALASFLAACWTPAS